MVTDLPLLAAGTVPFFIVQYPRAVAFVLGGAVAGILAAVVARRGGIRGPAGPAYPAVRSGAGQCWFDLQDRRRCCFLPQSMSLWGFLTFMASLVDTLSWRQINRFTLSDIANTPLPLLAAVQARPEPPASRHYFIEHESIFDPRLYDLQS